jgi:hypothetical protein
MVAHKATSFLVCCGGTTLSTQVSEKRQRKPIVRHQGRKYAIDTHTRAQRRKQRAKATATSSQLQNYRHNGKVIIAFPSHHHHRHHPILSPPSPPLFHVLVYEVDLLPATRPHERKYRRPLYSKLKRRGLLKISQRTMIAELGQQSRYFGPWRDPDEQIVRQKICLAYEL